MNLTEKDVVRFWSHVDRRGPDECWPWTGGRNGDGYGGFWVQGHTRNANKIACTIAHGLAPEGKPYSLHARHCTSRACCNPAHLRWGSHQENEDDKVALGRQYRPIGSIHWMTKLTEDDVHQIRELCAMGFLQREVARRFGVSRPTVSSIVARNTWRHI